MRTLLLRKLKFRLMLVKNNSVSWWTFIESFLKLFSTAIFIQVDFVSLLSHFPHDYFNFGVEFHSSWYMSMTNLCNKPYHHEMKKRWIVSLGYQLRNLWYVYSLADVNREKNSKNFKERRLPLSSFMKYEWVVDAQNA